MNSTKRFSTAALVGVALAALIAASASAQVNRGGHDHPRWWSQGATGGLGAQGALAVNPAKPVARRRFAPE